MKLKFLGKYRLLARLGRGGMGYVFEAEDPELDRRVAIKVLPKEFVRQPERLERFRREAQAVAKLSHPHVVTIHDIGRHEDLHFLVMELMPGGSLQDRLGKLGALDWREATRIAAATCRGLSAAHRAGLVHRDIKPANVLLTAEGQAKLADFGLVRSVDGSAASLTAADIVQGTPNYMSPEQCRGDKTDAASDIYSLGATYYALLTGSPPFPREQTLQILFAHAASPPPDASRVNQQVPPACAEIVARAMAKSPLDRYSSAEAMAEDLEAALGETAAGATRSLCSQPTAGQTWPPAEQEFSLAMAAPTRAGAPPASGRRSRRAWLIAAGGGLLAAAGATALWLMRGEGDAGGNGNGGAGWTSLFNGSDMSQWTAESPGPAQWTLEDGAIVGRGGYGYLFSKLFDAGDFALQVEARINQGGNSGVFFRCQPNPSLPVGYEAHIAVSEMGDLHRNGLPGGPSGVTATQRVLVSPDEWVRLEITAQGRRMSIEVNGQTTVEYDEPHDGPLRGRLALQCADERTIVRFRRLRFRPLN